MGEEDSDAGGPRRASGRRARRGHSIDVRSARMGQSRKASQRKLPEEPSKLEMRGGAVQTPRIEALPLPSYVALGKLYNVSKPQVPPLKRGLIITALQGCCEN